MIAKCSCFLILYGAKLHSHTYTVCACNCNWHACNKHAHVHVYVHVYIYTYIYMSIILHGLIIALRPWLCGDGSILNTRYMT